MSRRLSKKQRKKNKEQNKINKIKRTERKYSQGLDKKKHHIVVSPRSFFIIKSILVVLTVLAYFYYSPLLILCAFLFILSYVLAIYCQRYVNKSYLKQNQLTIPKYDSALGLILIVITSLATLFGFRTFGPRRFGRFANTWFDQMVDSVKNFGTLLTGQRNIFQSLRRFTMRMPPGFNLGNIPSGMIPPSMPARFINLDNLPIEFMFSNLLSTTMTILVFLMIGISILSMGYTFLRIKKINSDDQQITFETKINILSDEEIYKILDYGIIEEEV